LAETLKDAVNHLQQQHSDITFDLNLVGSLGDLGETLNINIYRIVQESINNALKHANASKITVTLTKDVEKNTLTMTISDDGVGMVFSEVDQNKHFGLLGIRERVQGFHGDFNVVSEPNSGTTLQINIPLNGG